MDHSANHRVPCQVLYRSFEHFLGHFPGPTALNRQTISRAGLRDQRVAVLDAVLCLEPAVDQWRSH